MGLIVSKFGGSSVENATQIRKVKDIIKEDAQRKVITVSAPGKERQYNEKITDHLFNLASRGEHFASARQPISPDESFQAIVGKFEELNRDLGVEATGLIEDLKEHLQKDVPQPERLAWFASRGEHFNAQLIARYLTKEGMAARAMLPEEWRFLVSENLDDAKVLPVAYENMKALAGLEEIAVVPGYYGVTRENKIAVFSRGGSDLTGGELAYGLQADLYENWTDTDGIYEADPRIIPEAKVIPRLTYKEIRLLSSKGFDVFHFDAMINCKKRSIPINIRNTNNPESPGTVILTERVPEELIAGIARLDQVAYIYMEKDTLGETGTFTEELLDIFKKYEIKTYHYPTDKDDIAVLLDQTDLTGKINNLKQEIMDRLEPDTIRVQYDLSILSPVGIGMRNVPGVIAQAAAALKDENISIETIDQGPAQISFHLGVLSAYADTALRALFDQLIVNHDLKVTN